MVVINTFLDETIDNVICAMVWFIYPIAFMIITAKFHPTRYQEKIKELLFYWYITEALSGRCSWIEVKHLVNPEKTLAWSMKRRVKNGLTLKIQNESEARVAAKEVFLNVAKPGSDFIELGDLARFLPETDALSFLSIFEQTSKDDTTRISTSSRLQLRVNKTTRINCSDLLHFMVYAYRLEMSLVLSLKDTDSIMNTMRITVFLIAVIADVVAIVPVYLMLGVFGSMIYTFFVFLVLRAIKHSQQWSLILQSTMLFFFRHPYAVGEKCINDGVEMVVKKINFLSVTFVGLDMKEYQISSSYLRSKWRIDLFRGSSSLEKMQLVLSESQDATVV
ncbi:unnamed protein product [Eruca vesicaria subsp. sativa]|uniref:Uncharacterized protein n=1 Tax=Eruca vesicaria subsp. sativa TaxID=29727 RepID=A0ABC8LCP5_ERUVS|nr:unnamed protein product [Eruca vesicaria subsp. sativa]